MAAKPTALITGAASGLGQALAAGFVRAGYAVTAVDRAAGEGIAVLDITDSIAVNAFAAKIKSLSVLINAAGIIRRGEEYDIGVFETVIDVNLVGGMRVATACKPALARARGAVINIASILALFGAPHAPAYAASKGAIVQLTKSLAIAWAKDNIRVNCIAPGWFETPLSGPVRSDAARNAAILARTPMGRWGDPEELVGPALFLASDAARFVTGVVLPVDGGYSAM